jgi:hypothetical protein
MVSFGFSIDRFFMQKYSEIYLFYDFRLKRINHKDGLGIMFWKDGTKFEGQFANDR